MAERDKEELARSLEGIVSGDQSDTGQSPMPEAPKSARPGKPRPAAPQQVPGAPRLVPARPIVPPGAVPMLPGGNRPGAPAGGDKAGQVPAVPSAQVPRSRPAAPIRPAVPSAPAIPSSTSIDHAALTAQESAVVDDDDLVIVPAPSSEVLAHMRHAAPMHAPRLSTIKSLDARRTVIPILLTIAAVLVATSTLRLLTSPNTPLSTLPRWIAWAGYAIAGLLFAVALLNMLYVRSELVRASSARSGQV